MSFAITDLNTGSSSSGATAALFSFSSIPIGSLVVVGVTDASVGSSGGSMTDSGGNTYTSVGATALNGNTANGFAQIFYSRLTAVIPAFGTITYTKKTTGSKAVVSGLAATGSQASPLDTAVTATSSGSGVGASVTSGTPSVPNELLVGWIGGSAAMTKDPANGWTSPPLAAQATGATAADRAGVGAQQTHGGTSTVIHAPVTGAGVNWANIIVGFKPTVVVGGKLFRPAPLAIGTGGPFFRDPMQGM